MRLPQTGFEARRWSAGDGARLYYRVYGAENRGKPDLLCLTGMVRNSQDFHEFALRMAAQGHRVICPDYRGRGQSPRDNDVRKYKPTCLLRDIASLIDTLELERFVAVGSSLGGILTMALAILRPGCLAGAVINDIGPDVNNDGLARIKSYIGRDHPQPDWDTALSTIKSMFPHLQLSESNWWRVTEGTFIEGADGMLHVSWDPRIGETISLKTPEHFPLWKYFHALRHVPVLALRGEVSDVLKPETFARMRQELPHILAVEVKGAGHTPNLSETQSVIAVNELLDLVHAAVQHD